jgi:hypothetical protein
MGPLQLLRKKPPDRPPKPDQRSHVRVPSRYYAYLHAATGAVLSECLVKDLSQTGARIILPKADRSLPPQIMLRVTGEATPFMASVIWQAGGKCGLKFTDAGSG